MLEPLIASRLRMPSPIHPTGSETVAADDLIASDIAALYVVVELLPLPGRSILRLPLGLALVAIDMLLGGSGSIVALRSAHHRDRARGADHAARPLE